jgi:hypothetical protein
MSVRALLFTVIFASAAGAAQIENDPKEQEVIETAAKPDSWFVDQLGGKRIEARRPDARCPPPVPAAPRVQGRGGGGESPARKRTADDGRSGLCRSRDRRRYPCRSQSGMDPPDPSRSRRWHRSATSRQRRARAADPRARLSSGGEGHAARSRLLSWRRLGDRQYRDDRPVDAAARRCREGDHRVGRLSPRPRTSLSRVVERCGGRVRLDRRQRRTAGRRHPAASVSAATARAATCRLS